MESFRYWLGSGVESNGPATTLVGRTNVSTVVIGKREVSEAQAWRGRLFGWGRGCGGDLLQCFLALSVSPVMPLKKAIRVPMLHVFLVEVAVSFAAPTVSARLCGQIFDLESPRAL